MFKLAFALIFTQAIVNLAGSLSPELSFDALWYHLTLPKLYLGWHKMPVVPGGLLYYSGLPQLTELLYTLLLPLGGEILVKTAHWLFGVICLIVIYKLSRKFLSKTLSIISVLTFYSIGTVGWLSTTAYIDLARTFFELTAIYLFFSYCQGREKSFFFSAIFLGLAISCKIHAVGTLAIILILIAIEHKRSKLQKIRRIFLFALVALIPVIPWLWRAYHFTGNPFYPLFTQYTRSQWQQFPNLKNFLITPWRATFAPDSLFGPQLLILLPFIIAAIKRSKNNFLLRNLGIIAGLGFLFWSLTPPLTIRYLLPYTPLVFIFLLSGLERQKRSLPPVFGLTLVAIFIGAVINLGARSIASLKFIPFLTGKQTKSEFLAKNLNFKYGDFYDVDNYFAEHIDSNDLVLICNIHNLYYVNFPFVHESWAQEKTKFTHILLRDADLPGKYQGAILTYESPVTGVKLYRLNNK